MTLTIKGHGFGCELERLSRLFYPDESIRFVEPDTESADGESTAGAKDRLHADIFQYDTEDGGARLKTTLTVDGRVSTAERILSYEQKQDKECYELSLADGLYELLRELSGYTPPWGMLTGVRPVKLMRMLLAEGGESRAENTFLERFHCSEEKYKLCRETMKHEQPLLDLSRKDSFSLYISIPFCPTRCSYCSFVSQSVEKAARLLPEYVRLLIDEIEYTAKIAKQLSLRLETVYMGGGTPTTLSAEQMAQVLGAVNRCFDMSHCREFTVEAGRPDTVTYDKLLAIKNAGVGRISINPQTLSDEVLQSIGRRHTAAQVYEAMELARRVGFDSINMDMIAGLPGDTLDGFGRSLEGVLSMQPENVTVHTLSMKRASTLVTDRLGEPDAVGVAAGRMLELCERRLNEQQYHPYYLYRQTRMVGNLENVGWSLDGHDGLYNVYIMDETHTILAVGAGAVTKLREPGVNHIERIYNYKFPYEYNTRFDSIIDRKRTVAEFYEKLH